MDSYLFENARIVDGSKEDGEHDCFVRVSGNPDIFSLGARMICVEHDIRPCF